MTSEAQAWDTRYAESDQIWSGNPNAALVAQVSDLPAGHALDLGSGEGGDAIWLARRGWRVTAVDISRVALDRAARHATDAGVADRIDWQRRDLGTSFPAGSFDLVSAQFLHSRGEMPREQILRAAAGVVAPGGVLLIEGHAGLPHWEHHAHAEPAHDGLRLPTPAEVLESLALPPGQWEVLVCAEHDRLQDGPDGLTHPRTDSTVKVRRRPS